MTAKVKSFSVKDKSILNLCETIHVEAKKKENSNNSIITKCAKSIFDRKAARHWNLSSQDFQNHIRRLAHDAEQITDDKTKEVVTKALNKLIQKTPQTPSSDTLVTPTKKKHKSSFPKLLEKRLDKLVASLRNAIIDEVKLLQQLNSLQEMLTSNDSLSLSGHYLKQATSTSNQLAIFVAGDFLNDTEVKQLLKTVCESLNTLIDVSNATSTPFLNLNYSTGIYSTGIAPKGIVNQGGNDCFLNALCQMSRRPALQRYLVDQLPEPLWETLVADNTYSTAIRQALTDYTPFGNAMRTIGLDPMTDQLDTTEAASALFNAIDRAAPVSPVRPTPIPPIPPIPPQRRFFLIEIFYAIGRFFQSIGSGLHWLALKIIGYADEPSVPLPSETPPFHYQPSISAQRRSNKALFIPFKKNPLISYVAKNITRHPPERLDEVTARSKQVDPTGILPIAMHKNNQGAYSFDTFFPKHFELETIHNSDEWIENKLEFDEVPEYMTLSFKRFEFNQNTNEGRKITEDIENIPLELTLSEETLSDKAKANNLPRIFDLTSFISHRGTSNNGGHYVAYRKEKEDWFFFNDGAPPVKCSETDIKQAVKQAYLVFYERKG